MVDTVVHINLYISLQIIKDSVQEKRENMWIGREMSSDK